MDTSLKYLLKDLGGNLVNIYMTMEKTLGYLVG
jgi:hypothetical protein